MPETSAPTIVLNDGSPERLRELRAILDEEGAAEKVAIVEVGYDDMAYDTYGLAETERLILANTPVLVFFHGLHRAGKQAKADWNVLRGHSMVTELPLLANHHQIRQAVKALAKKR